MKQDVFLGPGEHSSIMFRCAPTKEDNYAVALDGLGGIFTAKGFKAGFIIMQFPINGRSLTTAIWYPTISAPSPYYYNRSICPGEVAYDGVPNKLEAPYPLVVFSHGYLGCGTQSTCLCQSLAEAGYVVVAPDHQDATWCTILGGLHQLLPDSEPVIERPFINASYRITDIKGLIDSMVFLNNTASSIFYEMVSEELVAVAGHSLGGWASYVLSGGTILGYEDYQDDRIKACLALAGAVFEPMENSKVRVPLMSLFGDRDQQARYGGGVARRAIYDNSDSPKFLGILKDSAHFVFADTACIGLGSIENCRIASRRMAVSIEYSIAFLDRYIKGKVIEDSVIHNTCPEFSSYEYEI